jgi:transcriptional regulator with XRE-family HTH domain
MLKIGSKIKKLRELKNYTQEYMAHQLHLSVNGYGKIERNDVDVTIGRLEEIAKILETDVMQILAFDEKMIFNVNQGNNNIYGLFQTQKVATDEGFKQLIAHLQDENKFLRTENQRLTGLIMNQNRPLA